MAGVIKKKSRLFETEAALPQSPKSVTIREADGGFVIEAYPEEKSTKVAKTLAAALKMVKAHFGETSESGPDDQAGDD